MKLRRLLLKDFRGFSEQEIVFNENSTVIFGINGSGKSSILRSINLLYANIPPAIATINSNDKTI